ncbi:MAG: hypothetical protein KAR44_03520 [Candidatus Aegiribacteria sp.]|nr:hypothetical protein [Candidatus Aegiribacteria sp.]
MKNRWYRYFWTELGRRIAGTETALPEHLPEEMVEILRTGSFDPGECYLKLNSKLSSRKSRNIYGYTWSVLREHGFSRSLRLMPWPGITMLIPFYRDGIGISPQSFSRRIPPEKRAMSLVGRSAAALRMGYSLWVVPAVWNDDILSIFSTGGVKACSLDNLADVCRKGFS